MTLDYLTMDIEFNMKSRTSIINGDMKEEVYEEIIEEVISDFLIRQMGKGADDREPNEQDIYHITLRWYPANGDFKVGSDTGNKGLRDGILSYILTQLP